MLLRLTFAYLFVFLCLVSCTDDDPMEQMMEEIMEEEIEMMPEPTVMFTLSSDNRSYSVYDNILVWLTDSEGMLIDSSYSNLQVNETTEIFRPDSFTGDAANVNILSLGDERNSYQSFSNIELPNSYNYIFGDRNNAYPYGDGSDLHEVVVTIDVSDDFILDFPESIYGRSLTAPTLEDMRVDDASNFSQTESGSHQGFLSLHVNKVDQILFYNPITEGNFNREKIYSTVIDYDRSIHGDSITLSHLDFQQDEDAVIIDPYSQEFSDGIYPYSGTITDGEVFDKSAPTFAAIISVQGIGVPSQLMGMNISISVRTDDFDEDKRTVNYRCGTEDINKLTLSDEQIRLNDYLVDYTNLFDYTVSNVNVEYDLLLFSNFYRDATDKFFSYQIFQDDHSKSFVFPEIPAEFEGIIDFSWDHSVLENERSPNLSFIDYTVYEDLNGYFEFANNSSFDIYENHFRDNCTITNSFRL